MAWIGRSRVRFLMVQFRFVLIVLNHYIKGWPSDSAYCLRVKRKEGG